MHDCTAGVVVVHPAQHGEIAGGRPKAFFSKLGHKQVELADVAAGFFNVVEECLGDKEIREDKNEGVVSCDVRGAFGGQELEALAFGFEHLDVQVAPVSVA
jgi:hypothetical protein